MTKEDINRIASEYFDDKESEHEMDEVFDLAKKALEKQMQESKTGHWIPVSERLPEDEVEVLIYTTDKEINKAYRRIQDWTENQMEWLVFETLGYGYIYDDDEVLAWMPLPEPYEPQESEDKE